MDERRAPGEIIRTALGFQQGESMLFEEEERAALVYLDALEALAVAVAAMRPVMAAHPRDDQAVALAWYVVCDAHDALPGVGR